ncbi:MAG: DUF2071 domain-containing protein [Chitinophagaceae bacterium]|nr:DUF2071 domain-containing protein [Chitinophagaceae bacterium]
MAATFLTAEWKNLIMANYIVDPAILQPYLPYKTELDFFNGNAYVSLVGFMFMETRLMGFKIPFHINFEEVNLRFYVKHYDHGEWKRGTVFIKEIVPKPAISFIANTIYHEKYDTKKMDHFSVDQGKEFSTGYLWKHQNKWNKIEAVTETLALPMQPGSEEEFIAEHYWGYSKFDGHTTFEYNVRHPAWRVFKVKNYNIDCDFASLYGPGFASLQTTVPDSVFMAEGSAVSVLKKRRL